MLSKGAKSTGAAFGLDVSEQRGLMMSLRAIGVVVFIYNLSTRKVDTGRFGVQNYPQLHCEPEASLGTT